MQMIPIDKNRIESAVTVMRRVADFIQSEYEYDMNANDLRYEADELEKSIHE